MYGYVKFNKDMAKEDKAKMQVFHKGDGSNHSHVKGSKKGHLKNGGSKGAKVLGNTSIGSKAGKTSSKLPSMLDVDYRGRVKTHPYKNNETYREE